MRTALNVLRVVVTVLLCIVLLVNLWFLAARFLLREELPKILGFSQAIVISGSMEPTFSAGDMLLFREAESYGAGDVVIFRQGGALVTHRIVGETKGGFVTRGDANNTEDGETLDPERIEGRLLAIVPGIGAALTFLRTPMGLLLLILVGILLIEGPNIIEAIRRKRVK